VEIDIRTADNKLLKPISTGTVTVVTGMVFTPDGRTLYAATYGSVVPIRTATNTAGKPIAIAANGSAVSIALTPDGRTLYAAGSGAGTVTPIRTATNKPGKPIAVGGQPYGIVISPHGRTAYTGVILGGTGPWAVVPGQPGGQPGPRADHADGTSGLHGAHPGREDPVCRAAGRQHGDPDPHRHQDRTPADQGGGRPERDRDHA
jgi:YVTN family beta-propeller protein